MQRIALIAVTGLLMGQVYCPTQQDPPGTPGLLCDGATNPPAIGSPPAISGASLSTDRRSAARLEVETSLTCTATILSPRTLLTAAHCFDFPNNYHPIYLGDDASPLETTATKTRVHHDAWSRGTIRNPSDSDLLLLYTDEDLPGPFAAFPFTEFMGPMCKSLIAQGYGVSDVGNKSLNEGEQYLTTVNTRTIVGENSSTALVCSGDSGAPLWATGGVQPWLVGVASRAACQSGSDTTWIRVEEFQGWLAQNIRWSDADEEGDLVNADIPTIPSDFVFWETTEYTSVYPSNSFNDLPICYSPPGTPVTCDTGFTTGPRTNLRPDPIDSGSVWSSMALGADDYDIRRTVRGGYDMNGYLQKAFEDQDPIYIFQEILFDDTLVPLSAGASLTVLDVSPSTNEIPAVSEILMAPSVSLDNPYPSDSSMKVFFDWSGLRAVGSSTADSGLSSAAIPIDNWTELEVRYVRSSGAGATDGSVHLYIDGTEVIAQTNIETWRGSYPRFNANYGMAGAIAWTPNPVEYYFRRNAITNYKVSDGTSGNGL